jgi:hypothetical protein
MDDVDPRLIKLVREVMGGIDLDPATHPEAQERVRADRYFTKADDALNQPWHGRVFLNPPFARGLVETFGFKLLAELVGGRVSEAIVLVNASTDAAWFRYLRSAAAAECFPTASSIQTDGPANRRSGKPSCILVRRPRCSTKCSKASAT